MIKDIPGYEGVYAATDDGKIWSYPKPLTGCAEGKRGEKPGRWLKPVASKGYQYVNLGAQNMHAIHRLVMLAHVGEPNDGENHVNHKDGDKSNNSLSNLEWCSQKHNNQHAWRTGLCRPARKVDIVDAETIRSLYKMGRTQKQLAGMFGVGRSTIQRVLYGTHGY